MKVAILGSGVVGVTTAYYLSDAGAEVTVIERQPAAALETSYANAGQVSAGYASPWAAPGVPLRAVKWMFEKHAPLIVNPKPDLVRWSWLWQMLQNCSAQRYEVNKSRMLRLAGYSRDCLIRLRDQTGIQYDEGSKGTLQLFRTQQAVDNAAKDIEVLSRYGVEFEVLDRAGCLAVEPGLTAVSDKVAGGLRLPNDETGDCFKFTTTLAERAAAQGVKFDYGTRIQSIELADGQVSRVITDKGPVEADRYIVNMGSYTPLMMKSIGIRLPIYPVKGYSATIPVTDSEAVPVSTIMDEKHKVALTRLGDRVRVAGMAELTGYDLTLTAKRCETLAYVFNSLFPNGGDVSRADYWTGLRPMTPDGPPVLGPTRYPNLFLNSGHGTLGWTMACGSGKLVSDWVTGTQHEIDTEGLTIARYSQ